MTSPIPATSTAGTRLDQRDTTTAVVFPSPGPEDQEVRKLTIRPRSGERVALAAIRRDRDRKRENNNSEESKLSLEETRKDKSRRKRARKEEVSGK
ncbi:hypothetical protein NDU88_004727 [Pleurodeles waltl]|uniref:Uncharacterized protein n=1 Tax=Pleurodeles waltl TaxID=8319 RepID=A0AAV7QGQ0_PLEWA|nr:hypothetical protein NDU88_004727 [Pleurodeles waltl]